MVIIGHHTCARRGSPEEIEKNGPFPSKHEDENPKNHKFLGSGYYFWDNNLGIAHWWGKTHYNEGYYIFQGKIRIKTDIFLDLVGNRIDMIWLEEMMSRLSESSEEPKKWELGKFIELLKRLDSKDGPYKGLFPYRAIRAIDYKFDRDEGYKFVEEQKSFTRLKPVMMICLLDLGEDMLECFSLYK